MQDIATDIDSETQSVARSRSSANDVNGATSLAFPTPSLRDAETRLS